MMHLRVLPPAVAFIFLLLSMGCRGAGVVAPLEDLPPGQLPYRESGGCAVSGPWSVILNENNGSVEVIEMRGAAKSMNALSMLQYPAPVGLQINPGSVNIDPVAHTASLEIRLIHPTTPVAGLFTGFDVRGIVFGPDVTNADGWTSHLNPSDFTSVPWGYIDGLLGTPDWIAGYDAPYSGYKYFADNLSSEEDIIQFFRSDEGLSGRGKFGEGEANRRTYLLDWTDSSHGFLIFNYAVLASYAWPKPGASSPYELDDFGIGSANAAEAFCITAVISDNSAYSGNNSSGGSFDIDVEVWDWQGLGSTEVSVESADGASMTKKSTSSSTKGTTAYSRIFSFADLPVEPVQPGDMTLVITATDHSRTFGKSWFGNMPVSNWRYDDDVYTILEMALPVADEPPRPDPLLDEDFISTSGWDYGPGNFWNINWFTASAADNREEGLCYGTGSGPFMTWLESPVITMKTGCYNLPLMMRMHHQLDIENYYDRCWVEMKTGLGDWTKIQPSGGWKYGIGGWWDGTHQESESVFFLSSLQDGDDFQLRFITKTLDGNNNCKSDGYNGWQIFDVKISDE